MSSATMKKAMQCCAFVICCFASILLHAQTNTVTIGSKSMNAKAVLWLVPNGGQGLLLPSVTTSVRSGMGLQSTDKGMVVFDNQENKLYLWDGTAWIGVSGNSSPVTLSGDVSGVSGNTVVTAIRGKNISTATPANQQVLKFNSTSNQWEPAADATTSLTAGAGIIITAGQVSVNTGTGANQIVQLDATGKLPAVDGSQLTNLPGGGDITSVIAGVGLTGGAATGAATLNVDVGTTANKIVQLDATGKLPAVDGSLLTNLAGDISSVVAGTGLTGGATSGAATLNVDVGTTANKIVQLDASGRLPAVDGSLLTNLAGGGDITGVTAGTGLTGGATSGNATLNVDVGTTANKIVQLDATGKLPAVDGSLLTNLAGDISSVVAGTGLTGGATSGAATLNVDVGTAANKIVQLDATGKLPAVDGSQLTNLPGGGGDITGVTAGTGLTGGATSGNATLNVDVGTTANKIVQLDATGKLPAVDGSLLTNLAGDISSVVAGTGLTGGATSGNATLNVDVGTTANKIVQLDATGKLPAVDGSLLTNLAGDISSVVAGTGLTGGATSGAATLNVDVGTTANKIVQLDATGKLPAVDGSQLTNLPGGGDITGVTAGTGLTGGATSGNATLNVDVGTTANKIVQLDASGRLPALDGSLLTNLAGDISSVVAGTGLTGGATSGAATLNVDVGTTANKIVQLDASGRLPEVDGSLLTNLAGDISSVVAGTGLTGGATSGG